MDHSASAGTKDLARIRHRRSCTPPRPPSALPEGRKTFQSGPFTGGSGSGNTFEYDALGRVRLIRHADNSTIEYTYAGTDVAIRDEDGRTTTQHWQAFGSPGGGRLASVTDAANRNWYYSYNALGSLTRVQGPDGPDRTWAYNTANQLRTATPPESGTATYAHP